MSNQFLPKTHPSMGLPRHWSIADLEPRGFKSIAVLTQAAGAVTSAAVSPGARHIQLELDFESGAVTCSLEVYKVVNGEDVLVKGFTGLDSGTKTLWLGNNERIDLEGAPVKVKITALTGGWISVSVKPLA